MPKNCQDGDLPEPCETELPLTTIGHLLLGLHVIATARRPQVLEDLAARGMSILALDVTDPASIEACRQRVEFITSGRLDILVNNA